MDTSKHRPRRLDGPTKSYNIVWPEETLDEVAKTAKDHGLSTAEFIRTITKFVIAGQPGSIRQMLDSVFLTCDPPSSAPFPDITTDAPPVPPLAVEPVYGDYIKGVDDACVLVSKAPRLQMTLATGETMGEDLAKRIKLDLGAG